METLAAATAISPTSEVEFEDLVLFVRGELTTLPPQQAEAFWLVCVEERSYQEVADLMAINANAVGVLVHRVRQHLRRVLCALEPVKSNQSTPRKT